MQTKTKIEQESPAGLLVVDSGNRPVYANAEAIRVLAYPEDPEKIKSSGGYLAEKIRFVVLNGEGTTRLPAERDFVSGRRHYRCRSFVLESSSSKLAARIVGVIMERVHQASFLVSSIGDEFHLTRREREAVSLLSEGLTSKEIAGRMQISPNTVKTFLRLTMIKMGVSSRSGILGKAFRH
jgi:DNA-binding CsgD family transcriptional regulator